MDAHTEHMVRRFFNFMNEREAIRLRKERGEPKPWTDNLILRMYKFTNVNREHDRTTRWMRDNWTGPNRDKPLDMQFFNCALFRYFGTVEFASELGWQDTWNPEMVEHRARQMLFDKKKVFTGAYVVTNGGISAPKYQVVVREYLGPLHRSLKDIVDIALRTNSWQDVATFMRRLPGFGGSGFMTKEVLQDVIHGTTVFADGGPHDLNTWCPAGPGARRGLNRIFGRKVDKPLKDDQALAEMLMLFTVRHDYTEAHVQALGIDLHCIQFQLCEFDKYLRVENGEGTPRSLYPGAR